MCILESKQIKSAVYGDIHKNYPDQWPPQNYQKYLSKSKNYGLEKVWVGR